MRWFRKRKRVRPVDPLPGEFIDLSTPEGKARFDVIMAGRRKRRDAGPPCVFGISGKELSRIVVEGRGPD